MNPRLPDGVVALHNALVNARIPYAFGGAIALAYSGIPRATRDLDTNVFLSESDRIRVLDAVATLFPIADIDAEAGKIEHTAQTRRRWDIDNRRSTRRHWELRICRTRSLRRTPSAPGP